jgi:hypothetical protein
MVWPNLLGLRSADCRVFLLNFSASYCLSSLEVLRMDTWVLVEHVTAIFIFEDFKNGGWEPGIEHGMSIIQSISVYISIYIYI